MSEWLGTYNYRFFKLDPYYNDATRTGVSSLEVGMTCTFTGLDPYSHPIQESASIEGTTGFWEYYTGTPEGYPPSPPYINTPNFLTPEYLNDNISGIANEFTSGLCWCHNLSGQISDKLDRLYTISGDPTLDSTFPYPSGNFPPVDPHDM